MAERSRRSKVQQPAVKGDSLFFVEEGGTGGTARSGGRSSTKRRRRPPTDSTRASKKACSSKEDVVFDPSTIRGKKRKHSFFFSFVTCEPASLPFEWSADDASSGASLSLSLSLRLSISGRRRDGEGTPARRTAVRCQGGWPWQQGPDKAPLVLQTRGPGSRQTGAFQPPQHPAPCLRPPQVPGARSKLTLRLLHTLAPICFVRQSWQGARELFFTDSTDWNHVNCVEYRCKVHSFEEYENLKSIRPSDWYFRYEYRPSSRQFVPEKVYVHCYCEKPINPDRDMVMCKHCK